MVEVVDEGLDVVGLCVVFVGVARLVVVGLDVVVVVVCVVVVSFCVVSLVVVGLDVVVVVVCVVVVSFGVVSSVVVFVGLGVDKKGGSVGEKVAEGALLAVTGFSLTFS